MGHPKHIRPFASSNGGQQSANTGYRPDIDGLRTLAIIPVVLFHARVPGFSGGFVGVDIFFVISGYLITGIITREIEKGQFSVIGFYERRIRRIAPALISVMACVLIASSILYFPPDFAPVPYSIVAALLSVSNFLFLSESSYFGASAHVKPVLHTWSLSVEEQFYLLFPVALKFVQRWAKSLRNAFLVTVFLLSLAASVVAAPIKPDMAFYLLPTRAWELMGGALLAVGLIPPIRNLLVRELAACVALALIGWAVIWFDERTTFPGLAAILPVLGAATLIHVAPGSIVGRLLSLRPMVFIGLISYSLYLWHWPIIVLAEYAMDAQLSGWNTAVTIFVASIVAVLSWRWIERPFRDTRRIPSRALFKLACGSTAAVLVVSGAAMASDGWPSRFSPDVLAFAAASKTGSSPYRQDCHWEQGEGPSSHPPCRLGVKASPSLAVWGDSHGVELSYALAETAGGTIRSVIELTSSSCAPVWGTGRRGCAAHNREVLAWLTKRPMVRTVVLTGFWASKGLQLDPATSGGLIETVQRLQNAGKRVVLVGAVPPNAFSVPRRLAHLAQERRLEAAGGTNRAAVEAATRYLLPAMKTLRTRGVVVIEPIEVLCPAEPCSIHRGGEALYFDAHHLSVAGARLVAREIASAIGDGSNVRPPGNPAPAR